MRAEQEWEMAGLARADGDKKAEARHTGNAAGLDGRFIQCPAIDHSRGKQCQLRLGHQTRTAAESFELGEDSDPSNSTHHRWDDGFRAHFFPIQ